MTKIVTIIAMLFLGFLAVGLLCGFTFIFMAFYLRRKKIKEIDRLVYGTEISSDSIFHQGLRLMNYGGAFAWRFGAKRSKLLYIREQFDNRFQRPFIVYFWLVIASVSASTIAILLNKFALHVT